MDEPVCVCGHKELSHSQYVDELGIVHRRCAQLITVKGTRGAIRCQCRSFENKYGTKEENINKFNKELNE